MASCLTVFPSEPLFALAVIPLGWAAVIPYVSRPVVPRGAFYVALTAPALAGLGAEALGQSLHDNRASLTVVVAVSLLVGLTAFIAALGLLRYVDIQFADAPSVASDVNQSVADVVSCLIPFDIVSREELGRMTELSPAELNLTLQGLDNNGHVRRIGGGLTGRGFRPLALTRHGRAMLTQVASPHRTQKTR